MSRMATARELSIEEAEALLEAARDRALPELYAFLARRASLRETDVTFLTDRVTRRERFVTVPAAVTSGTDDACDRASLLQDLEDDWNNQEPAPGLVLTLQPARRPAVAEGTPP